MTLMTLDVAIRELPSRRFAVRRHHGPVSTVEQTRRPLYMHLIMHELVGGPPVLRFVEPAQDDRFVDVLVGTTEGFPGDDEVEVEVVPRGWFAVMDYEGPAEGLAKAHADLRDWLHQKGHEPAGPLLQVHLMDEIEGITEQQLQVPLRF